VIFASQTTTFLVARAIVATRGLQVKQPVSQIISRDEFMVDALEFVKCRQA